MLLRALVLVPLLLVAVGAPAAAQPRPSARDDIYIVDVASGVLRNLTQTPSRPDGAAAWSPDGRSIAYTTLTDSSASDPSLWTTDLRLIDVGAKHGEWAVHRLAGYGVASRRLCRRLRLGGGRDGTCR